MPLTTEEEMQEWSKQGLQRLMAALADAPRLEAEITIMEVTVQAGQRRGEPVSMTPFNGQIN